MYRWRVVAACARTVFPDVILGLYAPEEMGAEVNEEGELLPPVRPNLLPIVQAPQESEISEAVARVTAVCRDLNEAKDSIEWKPSTFIDYVQDIFGDETIQSTDDLTPEQQEFVIEDLEERLRLLKDNS